MPTTWVTHCRLTVAPRSCESESPCCSFGKPRPRESQGPARYHWMQSPDEDSQGTIVFSVFLSRPCSQSEYVYRPSGLPPQKALPRSRGLMVPWQQRSLAMMGPTLAKWLLECQTILEFPEDGFGLHQLCPPPPGGRERSAAVETGTASHIAWRRRSGSISCSFVPHYDLYFPGTWQLLVSRRGEGKCYIVNSAPTVSMDLMLPDFNSGSVESGMGRSGQVFTCFDRAGTCRPF